jgi:hypothetical protein
VSVDPPLINAVFSGLVLVLGALATLITARGRRAGVQRREFRSLQRRYLAALTHVFSLETVIAGLGQVPPARPAAIDQADDEDDTATPSLPPRPRPETRGHNRDQT